MIRKLTEAALAAELDSHLAEDVASNGKNSNTSKTLKSAAGAFDPDTPRHRGGAFEPQRVRKHQSFVSDQIEAGMLSRYGLGMSYRDIAIRVQDL